jgi:predicted HTH transcriptional regulator
VGYLNTHGGVILLGVNDDGDVLGMEIDGFRNDDKLQLHFDNLIKQHVGLEFAGLIRGELRPVGGKQVFLIACGRSDESVFLKSGDNEDFYIRMGPSTRKLPPSRITDWTREHKS